MKYSKSIKKRMRELNADSGIISTLTHRAKVLEAEFSRLAGEAEYSVDEVRDQLKRRYNNG